VPELEFNIMGTFELADSVRSASLWCQFLVPLKKAVLIKEYQLVQLIGVRMALIVGIGHRCGGGFLITSSFNKMRQWIMSSLGE
jgi:hypothetical protein